jgi:hypothetical protein
VYSSCLGVADIPFSVLSCLLIFKYNIHDHVVRSVFASASLDIAEVC